MQIAPAYANWRNSFGLDYRIPNGTPLENYKFQVDTAREILNLPSRDGKRRGRVSQAF